MTNQSNQSPINIIQFSSRALEDINNLLRKQSNFGSNDLLEVIIGVSKLGEILILDGGNQNRKYLVTDNCTNQSFISEPKGSADEFAVRQSVPIKKDNPIINDLTANKIFKKNEAISLVTFQECGCLNTSRGHITWNC